MSAISSDAIASLKEAISGSYTRANSDTHVTATVTANGSDGVFVQFDGADDVTPVGSTSASVKPGDRVSVTIRNGNAMITGNTTAPATDDTRADEAYVVAASAVDDAANALQSAEVAASAAASAVADAETASQAAASAGVSAARAQAALDTMGDYDWSAETFNPNASLFYKDELGAHIVDARGSEGTYRTDINSEGMQVSDIQNAGKVVASFGAFEAQVGEIDKDHTRFTRDGIEVVYNERESVGLYDRSTIRDTAPERRFDFANRNRDGRFWYRSGDTVAAKLTVVYENGNAVAFASKAPVIYLDRYDEASGTWEEITSATCSYDESRDEFHGATVPFISDKDCHICVRVERAAVPVSVGWFSSRFEIDQLLWHYADNYHTGMKLSQGSMNVEKDITLGGSLSVGESAAIGGSLSVGGKSLLDLAYPVGAIYMSTKSTSPQTLFGGTWQRIANGRVLVGAGTSDKTYSNGATGGASTVSLTTDDLPSHHHATMQDDFPRFVTASAGVANSRIATSTSGTRTAPTFSYATDGNTFSSAYAQTGNTGGTQPHENMPPYLVVYMWERTA